MSYLHTDLYSKDCASTKAFTRWHRKQASRFPPSFLRGNYTSDVSEGQHKTTSHQAVDTKIFLMSFCLMRKEKLLDWLHNFQRIFSSLKPTHFLFLPSSHVNYNLLQISPIHYLLQFPLHHKEKSIGWQSWLARLIKAGLHQMNITADENKYLERVCIF